MDFRCIRRGCTAEDHLREFEYCSNAYGVPKVRRAVADLTVEQMALLQKIRLNWVNTKNPIYMFLSGSVVLDCLWEEGLCRHLEALANLGVVERWGTAYYLPHTLLSDDIVENLPLPEVSEEEYEVKKHYIVSVRGIGGEADVVEAVAKFIEKASVLFGKRVSRVIKGVPYVPQLANKYTDKIDILVKAEDNSLTGFGYVDVSKTYHLGFSMAKSFLLYGLDRVVVLHPYVDHSFHKDVGNRIKNRWDISEVGYATVNVMEEEMYFYKLPRANRYLRMSVSAQRYSRIIRQYVESL
ncbi:MAG: hypothetical protein QXP31_09215 [Pyrobaculum sp.]